MARRKVGERGAVFCHPLLFQFFISRLERKLTKETGIK
nr:MAG TPA: hypothetical protein [Bacteriophage sp.]